MSEFPSGVPTDAGASRAQSSVVGVAVLLGMSVVALGLLTAGTGVAIQSGLATVDAGRAGDAMAETVSPGPAGPDADHFPVTGGRLRVVSRTVRVLNESGTVDRLAVGGLVFATGERRVAAVAGAVVRGTGEGARFRTSPEIAADNATIAVSVSRLNASGPDAIAAGDGGAVDLQTDPVGDRRRLPPDAYRLTVETTAPAAWERHFATTGATTERRDFDGDGVTSVVASYPGDRALVLGVTDLRLRLGVTRA